MAYQTLCGDSVELLKQITQKVDFTFLDPTLLIQVGYTRSRCLFVPCGLISL